MSTLNINNARASDMENWTATEVAPLNTDGISDLKETEYTNSLWSQHWAYFNEHPELKSAILMKAIWNVGKGFTADPETRVILDNIKGSGKDTFEEILFNMEVCRRVGRDSFAEIIRDSETGTLINLKPLDPGSIRIIYDGKGMIKRYEQITKLGDKKPSVVHKFEPRDIFHLSNNRLADQIHGISDIESLDKNLLADLESFDSTRKIINRQAKPFIIFKLKTDDQTKIQTIAGKIDALRALGEDLYIPDDEDIISYEVVQVNPSAIILQWRQEVTNRFYRALGLPLVIFGSAHSTESGSKMEYLAHEQVFERDQKYIEQQVWQQLNLRINLIPPTSMLDSISTDEQKDSMQGMEIQPSDMMAGTGK